MKDLIRNRLEELTIEKWWDYGEYEEIRDKDYVANCILDDFHNLILARIKLIEDGNDEPFCKAIALNELKNLLK